MSNHVCRKRCEEEVARQAALGREIPMPTLGHRTTDAWHNSNLWPASQFLIGTCFYCGKSIRRLHIRSSRWYLASGEYPDGVRTTPAGRGPSSQGSET